MAIFGKNGFIWKHEVAFARSLLARQYEKSHIALPEETVISSHAEKIVDTAHIIAKKSGRNILEIVKDVVTDIKNKKA